MLTALADILYLTWPMRTVLSAGRTTKQKQEIALILKLSHISHFQK